MEKCEHGHKITHFCIYQYCAAKEAGGCQNCIKKYHSHVGHGDIIRTEDVDSLAQKFTIDNSVKPKCRQFQENVFSFFTQVRTQIQQTIEIVCKGMVNKIGYPLLSHLNHLSSYKRIKNKEYKKLTPKELKKIYLDCKSFDLANVTVRERDLYVDEIIQNFFIIEGMEKLMKDYQSLVKKLCKNFKHDSASYKKIQDLKKYLNSVLKLDKREQTRPSDNDSKVSEKVLENSPSDDRYFSRPKSALSNFSREGHQKNQSPQTIMNEVFSKVQPERNSSRNQYKNVRNFSIEKQVKINQFTAEYEIKITPEQVNTYESKEKQIFERKEKLMKMMSIKEKSLGKLGSNSRESQNSSQIKKNGSGLNSPPLLKYQKNATDFPRQKLQKPIQVEEFFGNPASKRHHESFLGAKESQNGQRKQKQNSTINLLTSPRTMKHSNSVRSLKEQLTAQKSEYKNLQDSEDKYKYGMMRLPSSDSNSSDTDNFFKNYLNTVSKNGKNHLQIEVGLGAEQETKLKTKRSRNTESTPSKIHLSNVKHFSNSDDYVKDEQKSAALYLMALEKTDIEDSIKHLKAALSYCPSNISAAEHLSYVYFRSNKAKQCLDLCTDYLFLLKKIQKPELKRNFLTNKSAALNCLGRYSESITLLESEIMNFSDAKMFKNLGDAYYFIGIKEKCQYNYEKAIKLNSKFDEAMYNLAACIFTQGNIFNADIWISKALEIDPKNSDYQMLKKQIQNRLADVQEQ